MKSKFLKDLKVGEFFTLKPIEYPKEEQVYLRGMYGRSEKKYICSRFDDFDYLCSFCGEKIVYVGFKF